MLCPWARLCCNKIIRHYRIYIKRGFPPLFTESWLCSLIFFPQALLWPSGIIFPVCWEGCNPGPGIDVIWPKWPHRGFGRPKPRWARGVARLGGKIQGEVSEGGSPCLSRRSRQRSEHCWASSRGRGRLTLLVCLVLCIYLLLDISL